MGALATMLQTQRELQQEFDPRAVSGDNKESCEYIKDMCTATVAEVMELMEETGWKPWSSSWHINVDAARAEWIDAWHFMMNMANKLGMDEELIYTMYNTKAQINRERIRSNYDGVSTKCPACKRALDDPATNCFFSNMDGSQASSEPTRWVWCAVGRRVVSTARV